MSVINQMLQDLERRHAGPDDRRALPDEVRPLPAGTDRGVGPRVAGWMLAVAGAGAVAWVVAAGSIALPSPRALGGTLLSAVGMASPDPTEPVALQAAPAGADPVDASAPAIATRLSSDLAVWPTGPRPAAEDRPSRDRGAGDRPAKRDVANAETERLVRDAAGTPVVPAAASGGPAPPAASPAVVSSFAGSLPSTGVFTSPFASPPVVVPVPAVPVRPVDASPARIDRQEREPSVRERAEAIYRRGVEAMHEGRMPAAEQALREALTQFPAHEAARQTLLGILVQQRRNADAEALLLEGQRQNPAQVGFAMALARLQAERGDTSAALESMQRSAAAGRDRPDFLGFQAGLLARAGRHADAVVQYRSALRMAPQNAVWWMGLGISLESDRRPAEAAEAFQRAREAPGLSPELTAYVDQRLRGLQR
jgi:MSHA biogenesis protein MshN